MRLLKQFCVGAIVVLLALFAFAGKAQAGKPSAKPESATLTEVDGKWKLILNFDYGKEPELQFISMRFSFEQVTLFERAITDESGDKPVLTKKALVNQPPIIESMDVGFSDGTGKLFKTTKFNFLIRRDRGFEAGEYQLTIKKVDNDEQFAKVKLTLNGDNPIINRKSINFVDDKGKNNDASKVKSKSDPGASSDSDGSKDDPSGDTKPAGDDGSTPSGDVPPVDPKKGGCGCEIVGSNTGTGSMIVGLGLMAAAFARRRANLKRRQEPERSRSISSST